MAHYKIVNVKDLSIVASYDDYNPYGGDWGASNRGFTSVEMPDGLDSNGISVQDDEMGNLSIVEDLTKLSAYNNKKALETFEAFKVAKMEQAEADIRAAILADTGIDADYTTHLMVSQNNIYIAMNIDGSHSQTEIDDAKATLAVYKALFAKIQAIRIQRDADIALATP